MAYSDDSTSIVVGKVQPFTDFSSTHSQKQSPSESALLILILLYVNKPNMQMSYVASSQALLMPCKHWRWSQMETSGYEASSTMCLPYSGELSRKKTFANWWKIRFSLRKLSQIARLCSQRMPRPKFRKENLCE